ncbi:apolipoprotein L6-like isoform X1 [Callorhinchus milii]|nr:apolipoprotein L6-like isoform X1 [Callorhinchus milii]
MKKELGGVHVKERKRESVPSIEEMRDLEEVHDKELQHFMKVFPDQKTRISTCIEEIGEIADDIDKCQDRSNTAKVVGSAVKIVGGILAVGGALAAPFTLGASLGLTAAGAGMVIAGNVTNFTARVGSSFKRKNKKRQLDEIVKECSSALTEIDNCFQVSRSMESNMKHGKTRKRIKKLITKGIQFAAKSTLSCLPLLGEVTSLIRNVVKYKIEKKKAAKMIREKADLMKVTLDKLDEEYNTRL